MGTSQCENKIYLDNRLIATKLKKRLIIIVYDGMYDFYLSKMKKQCENNNIKYIIEHRSKRGKLKYWEF
jgi:hypothetical protein